MEELDLKDFEFNFLQLMGVSYIDGKFVNTSDNSEFTFISSEPKKFDSEESMMTYTFINNSNNTIELRRWNLRRGKENEICIDMNGYVYGVNCANGMNDIFVSVGSKRCDMSSLSYIGISEEKNNPLFIKTDIGSKREHKLQMVSSKDTMYTCAFVRGDRVVNYGKELDYTKENYAKILKDEIDKLKDEEHKKFFMIMLPTLVEIHESKLGTNLGGVSPQTTEPVLESSEKSPLQKVQK